jgi:RNA polymerase sigma-70 factor (ECF subfamily)
LNSVVRIALCQYNVRTLTDLRTLGPEQSEAEFHDHLTACASEIDAIHADCAKAYSSFQVPSSDFRAALIAAVRKYLIGFAEPGTVPSADQIRRFVAGLQSRDLYLALACAHGNEQAWWEFDREYRSFIERWARHLIRNGADADEVIDSVYADLFGTRVINGARQSKFVSYRGRGTLRGWLRTVMLHTVVDLYRSRKDEVSLEDWTESGDETAGRPASLSTGGGEELLLLSVVRERYESATAAALDESLAALDDHETLLLLYYHVDGLKLREIARIVEQPQSPIRRWFQRQSKRLEGGQPPRVHESTVMRWLEKVYQKVSVHFHAELANKHGLNPAEIEICKTIAAEDPAGGLRLNARPTTMDRGTESFNTEEA